MTLTRRRAVRRTIDLDRVGAVPDPGAPRLLARLLGPRLGGGHPVLHYQPVIRIPAAGDPPTVWAVEALVRWIGADGTLRGAAQVLHEAWRGDLMGLLTSAVLETATRQMVVWRTSGDVSPGVRLHVNLPGAPCPADVKRVDAALALSGLPAQALVLELTETGPPGVGLHHRRAAEALCGLGCALAIDDLGTGYASLDLLRAYPLDLLKLDRCFVAGAATDHRDSAVVRAVVGLGDALGLDVVLEGVETTAQWEHVRWLGAQLVQGWWSGRPAPAQAVPAMVADPLGAALATPAGHPGADCGTRSR